jgi:hypothetical protein
MLERYSKIVGVKLEGPFRAIRKAKGCDMARGRQGGTRKPIKAPAGLKTNQEAAAVVHSSVYFPTSVYEVLRKVAFDERVKIHDLLMEGIDALLQRRGYPSIERLKSGRKR